MVETAETFVPPLYSDFFSGAGWPGGARCTVTPQVRHSGDDLAVLPAEVGTVVDRWLLKLHGDVHRWC